MTVSLINLRTVAATLALAFPGPAVESALGTGVCSGGRFLVQNLPLGAPAIVVEDGRVSVDALCPPIVGTLKPSKTALRVRAMWPSCQALAGPTGLKASIDEPDCTTMTGVFKGRLRLCFDGRCDVQRFRQPFTARRAQ